MEETKLNSVDKFSEHEMVNTEAYKANSGNPKESKSSQQTEPKVSQQTLSLV